MTFDERDNQPNVLVTPRSEGAATTYLLYDGWRAEVDLRNPGVVWALRLDGIEPRPVSRALLDAIPEAPPIAPPRIPGAGQPGAVAGIRVGTVVRVTRVDADDYFVVLADGVARIGEVAANLIRSVDSQGSREIVSVSPDAVGDVPVVDFLPASTFPGRAGTTSGAGADGVLCAQWRPDRSKTTLWLGDSLPAHSSPIDLAQADGDGPEVDSVVMPSGRSAYVRAAALTGGRDDAGPLYLVTDSGVLFGIHDEDTAKASRRAGRSSQGAMAGVVAAAPRTRTEPRQRASRPRQCCLFRRNRPNEAVVATAAATTAMQTPAPPNAIRRPLGSGLDSLSGGGIGRASPSLDSVVSTRSCVPDGAAADGGKRVDDTVADERIPARRGPMRGVLDPLHDLSCGQMRRSCPHERGDSADYRRRVARPHNRHRAPEHGQRIDETFSVRIQRYDALSRRRDVHPRPGEREPRRRALLIDGAHRQDVVVVPCRADNDFHRIPVRPAGVSRVRRRVLIRALSEAADVSRCGHHDNVLDVHRICQRCAESTIVQPRGGGNAGDG